MRVLLIEPDAVTRAAVELMLRAERAGVTLADTGDDGYVLAKDYDTSVIILELGLPDMNGLQLIRKLRLEKVATPIIVLSGYADLETKVSALGAGADDYITKPFHRDELMARLHAVVRRSVGQPASVIQTGDPSVDIGRRVASVNGRDIPFTGKEYELLELLSLRKGTTVTKDAILNHMYGGWDEPELKIVDVFICKIRAKLRMFGADGLLNTVWGRGYVLREPVKAVA